MKKFILHIDALLVLGLVFAISLCFNFYQRYQYSELLQKHILLQIDALKADFSLSFTAVKLEKCNASIAELNK